MSISHGRSKIVENLAVLNYDTNNLYLAPYDWRLSYYNLEERDGYFSKLKATIEGLTWVRVLFRFGWSDFCASQRQKRKTVIAAHSMGSTVCVFLDRSHRLYLKSTP
jgi:phospholipid:diacylglycerol acyltransferase